MKRIMYSNIQKPTSKVGLDPLSRSIFAIMEAFSSTSAQQAIIRRLYPSYINQQGYTYDIYSDWFIRGCVVLHRYGPRTHLVHLHSYHEYLQVGI